MNFEFAAYCFLILLGFLVIGTVLTIDSQFFNSVWYASNWAVFVLVGVYFATNTNKNWLKWIMSCLVGWVFSAFTFEVICLFDPELAQYVNAPDATFVWYLMAFMIAVTIITIKTKDNGAKTH
ncbi:MAG: hypothetical protein HRU40_13555 [Saprospiraceae bacterium]|nr:hypothetical protein [Saprospiraceae bacterium]